MGTSVSALLCGWWHEDGIPPDAGGLIRCSHCRGRGVIDVPTALAHHPERGEHTAAGMTGAGQGGAGKRHRPTAPLTSGPPSGRRNPQKRRPGRFWGQPWWAP